MIPKASIGDIFHANLQFGDDSEKPNTATAGHISAWLLMYIRIGYWFGIIPFKIDKKNSKDNDTVVYIESTGLSSKLIHGGTAIIALAYIFWYILTLMYFSTSTSKLFLVLVDKLGLTAKILTAIFLVWWRKSSFISLLNSFAQFEVSAAPVPQWRQLLPYSVLLHTLGITISKLVSDFHLGRSFEATEFEAGLLSLHDGNSFQSVWANLLLAIAYQVHAIYMNFIFSLLFTFTGIYWELVQSLKHTLERLRASNNADMTSQGYNAIRNFQAIIKHIDECFSESLLLVIVTDFPYYVTQAIPSIFFESGNFSIPLIRRIYYLVSFYGLLMVAGSAHANLQDKIHEWIQQASSADEKNTGIVDKDQNHRRYQLIQWDLQVDRHLTLSLSNLGLGHLNMRLFMSLTSLTVTYTIIAHQFVHESGQLLKNNP